MKKIKRVSNSKRNRNGKIIFHGKIILSTNQKIGNQSVPLPFGYRCQIVSGVHNRIGSLKMYRECFGKFS
jgi:hypothetical protein